MSSVPPRVLLAFLTMAALMRGDQKKLTFDQRIELMRGLTSEYATVKAPLPRSKKPLDFNSDGTWDKDKWGMAGRELGPAARIGDLIQITHVEIDKDSIILEINNGMKRQGGSWKDHVSVGMGGGMAPISQGQATSAPSGTTIAIRFHDPIGEVTSADIKKMMKPVLDFEKHSVTENYLDTVTPEIKAAIQEKKPIEGMDRDQVLMALGRPVRKSRESKEGVDFEDWIYGAPPGRMMFVTFSGPKVVKVKETYAGLGGSIAESPKEP